ncbi:DivIVA domain-containing protein [Saccharopolyspora hordei]|uniref:Cell wall synthesis protein Wag31 n=1 Tax=Saccharopolyspora hordei TaxID=1838 RepID=A0A853AS88_9PSEU|nr:DivIVA domain-containing protein [Saccharopolyspora hordei]NYI84811.1 DivIVA domain-containing protein [Saccharopolyspora hordei]
MLTPDDVRSVVFARAWRRDHGYDEAEVDAFLKRVVATLRGKPLVTARDVLTVRFSPRKRGRRAYKKKQVDAFLDQVALTLMKREVRASQQQERAEARRAEPPRRGVPEAAGREADPPQRRPERVPRAEFDTAGPQQRALDKAEVDAFVDRVAATLRGEDTLTAHDLLTARFNPPQPGHPGYQEAGVVAFLVMAAASIRHLAPRARAIPAQRMPIARAFRRGATGGRGLTAEAISSVVFNEPPEGTPGYDVDEVDDLLDRVAATLRGADGLTAAEVRAAEFPQVPVGGYDPVEVDALLDLVAEHLDTARTPDRA